LQEKLDQDRQLAMYGMWVKEHFKDFKNVRLVWHYVAFDKEMESFRNQAQLDSLKTNVKDRIAEIEAEKEFPPNVTNLCHWCHYQSLCPMWKHEIELEEKPENEYLNDPGLVLVDEYVMTKAELDIHKKTKEDKLAKLKEAILHFCEENNVKIVVGSENKITVKASDSIKFPRKNTPEREDLVELLKKSGKFESLIDLDLYLLRNIFEKREWDEDILEELEKFAIREKSYSLSVSKK
jgi:hypothetical protein